MAKINFDGINSGTFSRDTKARGKMIAPAYSNSRGVDIPEGARMNFHKKASPAPAEIWPRGRVLSLDAIVKRRTPPLQKVKIAVAGRYSHLLKHGPQKPGVDPYPLWSRLTKQLTVPVAAAALALRLAFFGGMWFIMSSQSSRAKTQPQVLGDFTNQPSSINLPNAQLPRPL